MFEWTEETLGCLPDVLGLRRMEPERLVRVVDGGAATRDAPPAGCATFDLSCIFLSGIA